MDRETFITSYLSLSEELRQTVCELLGLEYQNSFEQSAAQTLIKGQLPNELLGMPVCKHCKDS